jgi:hypothetical protein
MCLVFSSRPISKYAALEPLVGGRLHLKLITTQWEWVPVKGFSLNADL